MKTNGAEEEEEEKVCRKHRLDSFEWQPSSAADEPRTYLAGSGRARGALKSS